MKEFEKMPDREWRKKPLVRAIVFSNCWLMITSASAPIYADPASGTLPTPSTNFANIVNGVPSARNVRIGNTLTVNQANPKAILNWDSFDIARDGKVQFVQPSAQSIALNKIGGNSPSEIFGQLGANGTIYLVNKNGIIFGSGAQVNVHGLLASTLNIDENKFLNSSISQIINDGSAALEGGTAQGTLIKIENGASIKTDSGGQVLMFAPNILNEGEISTPDGQTILAASKDKVYLATSNNDADLRGLMVEVATGGEVTNVGKIVAERGNITLLGLAVNQNGRVTATTSIDVNGSIRLLARDTVTPEAPNPIHKDALLLDDDKELPSPNVSPLVPIAHRSGTVKFGANSVTEVVADTQLNAEGKPPTAPDAQTQNHSRIDAMGQTIIVEDNASLTAKSGRINLIATAAPAAPNTSPERNSSRIYIGNNARLDVSGENIELPMERRLVEVELRGDELKDSPLQRNGVLHGEKVMVDIATGSPLIADLQPTLAKITKDVKERMVEGGTINLRSEGDVVLRDNATLNISGGSVTYAAGLLNTTKLLTIDGRIVDIGKADPKQRYAGILGAHTLTHPKWGSSTYGETSVFTVGTPVNRFTEGRNGGRLNIVAQALSGFDRANVQASTTRAATQRALSSAARGGAINIELGQIANNVQNVVIDKTMRSAVRGVNDPIVGDAYISADALNATGAGEFTLKANGLVTVTDNAEVQLNAGSAFNLTGTAIDFKGSVRVPSGTVTLKTVRLTATDLVTEAQPLVLRAGSRIDVSGNWINDLLDIRHSPVLAPLALKGGNITLGARGDLTVERGANLLANGGAQLTTAGAFKGGDGGSIKITTDALSTSDVGSKLQLQGQMSAYGFGQGGKLTLEANGFQAGGTAPSDARIFNIDPLFFTAGGFSDFTLTANLLGLEIAPQTTLSLVQKNSRVTDLKSLKRVASNTDISRFIETTTLDEYQRNPVNLHLNAVQTVDRTATLPPAYLRVGDGAKIIGDNAAQIDLNTTGSMFVNGGIQAHGGAINLKVAATPRDTTRDRGYIANQSLWLGNQASLDVSAAIERANDPRGQQIDKVFDAGSVNLTAERGFIVAEPGSVIDVSAPESYQIKLPSPMARKSRGRFATLNPAAGSISFKAADGMSIFSILRAQHTANSLAGSISYVLDGNSRIESTTNSFAFFPLEMELAQAYQWNGQQFGTALPSELLGRALVSTDAIANGGFGSLELIVRNKKDANDNFAALGHLVFGSDVALSLSDSLTLGATNIDVADHKVSFDAATVTLGSDYSETGGISQRKDLQTQAGTGNFSINGKTIDVVGNIGISGASDTNLLSAGDLRFRSVIDGTISTLNSAAKLAAAELTTPGNVTLQGTQIYPGTLSDYTINLSGTNSVLRTLAVGARTPLYSAGGKLKLQATKIEHNGVLAAPLGSIELEASDAIELASNSVIDVSAHDLLIPYGRLRGEKLNWIYPLDAIAPIVIDTPPEKSVALSAPNINMANGARVDLSGGGDIYAFEQIPGPGGSKDFLDVANANGAFAIIPMLGTFTAPYDSVEMQGTGIKIGTTVWLNGSNGLPAGNYAVLPAHYALLSGAYLITPRGTSSHVAGTNGKLVDGTEVVSGRFGRALSGQYETQWQTFTVETGAAARLRSEYKEYTGDQFFKTKNVDLAADAGRMTISAQTKLALNGTINSVSQNGRGAQVDIIADKIAVVTDAAQDMGDGVVRLVASALNQLGVDSLMLGGKRTRAGDDTNVTVLSESVKIENGAALRAPDVILAARDSIDVGANASVTGSGNSKVNTRAFVISGDGALLRASSAEQSNVQRTNSSGSAGDLRIASTATLAADRSLLFDASREMALPGTLTVNNGSLNISANRISLGDVPVNTNGVALSNTQLNALATAQTLRLSSRSSLDFFGNVAFSNQQTELNSGLLRNLANSDVRIAATDTLKLENGVNALSPVGSASSGGNLILAAKNIVLGREGDAPSNMQLQGFDNVQLGRVGTTQSVRGAGNFTLNSNSLTLYADTIGAANAGAKTQIIANGAVAFNKANAEPITKTDTVLGANLSIEGQSIAQGTRIELPSGNVSLTANGSTNGHVTLLAGSEIDVSGRSIATAHSSIDTSGGQVKLTSASGNVIAANDSIVRLSGGEKGGDAGALMMSAKQGVAQLNGSLFANKVDGARGANLSVDSGTLGNIDALLTLANNSGVDNSLVMRARNGDVGITQNARASTIDISADNGKLSLGATLDASGANGGHVALYARNDLELLSNARIDAYATADSGRGGKVELGSREGALRLAGTINVSGGNNGRNGQVDLRAVRNASNDNVAVFNSGIAITGAERVQLAAFKIYPNQTTLSNELENARLDAIAFMQNETSIKTALGSLVTDKFHLTPEIEVQSTGDLLVDTAVDFSADNDGDYLPDSTWRFGSNFEAPILTLRAAGDLNIAESISDGIYTYADPNSRLVRLAGSRPVRLLLSGDSASYRLIGGADLNAANPGAVSDTGKINITGGADILTGIGSIEIAAATNILVDSADSLIASLGNTPYNSYTSPYTSGSYAVETVPDTGTFNAIYAALMGNTLPQYPHAGGDVSLRAGGDIELQTPTNFFSSWMERIAGTFSLRASPAPAQTFKLTTWGVMLDYLKEGIAVIGGGNVNIDAGGSINNLNVALPSTGKQIGVNQNVVEITRSGSLFVSAGKDILSPRLLVDNARAELRAGGNIKGIDGGLQTVAVLGDTALLLHANGDIAVDGVFNTTVMPQSRNQTGNTHKDENYFFTYGNNSAVAIESVNGNVTLNNDKEAVYAAFNNDFPQHANGSGFSGRFGDANGVDEQRIFELYPGRLDIVAASGDIRLNNNLLLFPTGDGQLTLLAGGDLIASPGVKIRQSDVDIASLPDKYNPVRLLGVPSTSESYTGSLMARLFDTTSAFAHADAPVHLNDNEPSIVDVIGDIFSGTNAIYQFAESVKIAARDIISTSFEIQHNRASDVSEIVTTRDILYPLILQGNGALQSDDGHITVSGPGRLDVFAGRNINLGTSQGFISNGNESNVNLPDSGADLNIFAGINGPTAFSDPVLFNAFVDSYLTNIGSPAGSYIDWFSAGGFSGDVKTLVAVFTGKPYETNDAAINAFASLPTLTKQAISLEAWRTQHAVQLNEVKSQSSYAQLLGTVDKNDYSADLIDFVSLDRFGGDLRSAVSAVTHTTYATKEEAAAAMALLSTAQQHQIAKSAFTNAPATARRELLSEIFFNELRQAGVEDLKELVSVKARDGFNRGYTAVERMFPGNKWQGDISLVFSAVRTKGDGDINFFAPGGGVDVGLAGQFAGFTKAAGDLGIITQRYGAINGFADGDININQSRIASLDGAGITLWSSHGDIDAGRGAKSALSIPPPKVEIDPATGAVKLVFDASVSGSGIQSARNSRKTATDRGDFVTDANGNIVFGEDGHTDRDRYKRSLVAGGNYVFAPGGVVDAGDAGITVDGGLFVGGLQVVNADNINVGGVAIGIPTNTSISAGTLSLGNNASSATDSATGSMNDAIKQTAAALAEGNVAFVTVDVIGSGR